MLGIRDFIKRIEYKITISKLKKYYENDLLKSKLDYKIESFDQLDYCIYTFYKDFSLDKVAIEKRRLQYLINNSFENNTLLDLITTLIAISSIGASAIFSGLLSKSNIDVQEVYNLISRTTVQLAIIALIGFLANSSLNNKNKKAFYQLCLSILVDIENDKKKEIDSHSTIKLIDHKNINEQSDNNIFKQCLNLFRINKNEKGYIEASNLYNEVKEYYKLKLRDENFNLVVEKIRLESIVGKFDNNIKNFSINYLNSFMFVIITLYLEGIKLFEFQLKWFPNDNVNSILTIFSKGILFMLIIYITQKIIFSKGTKKERNDEVLNNVKLKVLEEIEKEMNYKSECKLNKYNEVAVELDKDNK